MARNNHVFVMGDITSDIYYDNFRLDGKDVPYLRLRMMVNGTEGVSAVGGLRVVVYGSLAELTYGHVQKGSRLAVTGHIQCRKHLSEIVFEVVATDVQFIRNVDWDRGEEVREDLVARGKLRPTRRDRGAPVDAPAEAGDPQDKEQRE